jgi:hypothetical protein
MDDEIMGNTGSPTATCSNVKFVFNPQQQIQQFHQPDEVPVTLTNVREMIERPLKRRRDVSPQQLLQQHHEESATPPRTNVLINTQQNPLQYSSPHRINHFPEAQDLGKSDAKDFVSSYKNQRRKHQKETPSKPKQVSFSEDEVKYIIEMRERQIREEYNRILSELLAEQFNQFAKFNQDCISRQFKNSDFSYTS